MQRLAQVTLLRRQWRWSHWAISSKVEELLEATRLDSHTHQQLVGGRGTARAQQYPEGLCQASIEGMALQMQWDNEEKFLLASLGSGLNTRKEGLLMLMDVLG